MRIFIVEDHSMFREVIHKICGHKLGHEVVGESGLGSEAVLLIPKVAPDVVLLDLELPDLDGFSVARVARQLVPSPKIVVISSHIDAHTIYEVERSGVDGFIDKVSGTTEVLGAALAEIAQDRTYFSAAFRAAQLSQRQDQQAADKLLSNAERKVLALIGQGWNDADIAHELEISPTTAQTHRSHILRKLDLANSTRLAAYAVKNGFTLYG